MSNVRLIYPELSREAQLAKNREDKMDMARDMLRLATASYVGAGAINPSLGVAARGMLQRAAIDYVETLVGRPLIDRNSEITWRRNETDPVVIGQSQQLELMAIASKSAQADIGSKYNAQFKRYQLSLAMLCQTAIRYVEALAGQTVGVSHEGDRALALEDGKQEHGRQEREQERERERAAAMPAPAPKQESQPPKPIFRRALTSKSRWTK